ncbi:MAG: DNA repair protein RecN [Pseudomonadota bacterium]
MLISLGIRNIVLIEALELTFDQGLNVLTGETGAGKSILLDALGFALGHKSRRELLRKGADEGSVTAVFECASGHPAYDLLGEAGISCEGDEIILRRVVSSSGRSSAFVNDQRTSGEALARIGQSLVEVHGQHDDRGMLNPRAHRTLLDQAARLGPLCDEVRTGWAELQRCRAELSTAQDELRAAAEDDEYLRHALDELTALSPEPGEEAALDTERRLIQAAARICEEVVRATADLSLDGAEGAASTALSRLTHVADDAEGVLEPVIQSLDRVLAELTETQRGLSEAMERLRFDPGRLDLVEERLFAIRGLARKHRVAPDELASLGDELGRKLEAIDAGQSVITDLEHKLSQAEAVYSDIARKLSQNRSKAAQEIDAAVMRELAPLKMERAIFTTEVTQAEPGPFGTDRVNFTAAINPGAPAGPIDRIASGGELSRFLLALKVCLSGDTGRAMIFDEIDRGVGGATAAAVGKRLVRLAEGEQVLVVTHSPQVAAGATHHLRISKRSEDDDTRTDVVTLDAESRVAEIARMLAGDEVTPEARSAAQSLMSMI